MRYTNVTFWIADDSQPAKVRGTGALVVRDHGDELDLYVRDGYGGGGDVGRASECPHDAPVAGHWSIVPA